LYDILVAVARAQKLSLNDAVIIISDLDDNSSKTDRITAENTFRRLGVRPAFILLPNPIPGTFEGQQLFRDVQYFANNTAGFYMSFPGPRPTAKAILPPIFYEQALAYYRLTFSSGSLEVNHVKVIVLDSSGKKMPHVEIRSSDAFQECHPTPS
jgi:hypothetical protein